MGLCRYFGEPGHIAIDHKNSALLATKRQAAGAFTGNSMALVPDKPLPVEEKRDVPGLSCPQGPVQNDLTISASSFHRQPCDHLVLPCTIVCNGVSHITHAMNDIGATG